MDKETFISWALDPARTVEERYTTELLVEEGVGHWNAERKIYDHLDFDASLARSRERKLNPAYEPRYSEGQLHQATEYLAEIKAWTQRGDRPVRNLAPLRFLTTLETVDLAFGEPADISVLSDLPALRKLVLGYPGSVHSNKSCADYTPLARCLSLRELTVAFNNHWPDFTGIEALDQLETFHLSGNLMALPRGASFPTVRSGSLYCMPLAARCVADLPHFPACEFLTLSGVEQLDGIEKMPRLRNLTIDGRFKSFAPLEALSELTCLIVKVRKHGDQEHQPRDVTPLARLPKLHFFQIGPDHYGTDMPRDYSPLVEAPALRELVVQRCPPVEMEVAAINAGLVGWDDLFLKSEPRSLATLRFIVAPVGEHPQHPALHRSDDEAELIDRTMREREQRWVVSYVLRRVSEQLGHEDWGTIIGYGESRTLQLTVESFEVVEQLPEIFEAAREALASLKYEYFCNFGVHLKAQAPEPSPAQKELDDQLQARRDEWEHDQRLRDEAEYLDRLHQLELKKQQGAKIDPSEFSPPATEDYPQLKDIAPPPTDETEPDFTSRGDDSDDDDGDIAVETDPDPLPSLFDDDHPLASNYRCAGVLTVSEVWFMSHFRGIGSHLMRREPDLDVPESKKPQ